MAAHHLFGTNLPSSAAVLVPNAGDTVLMLRETARTRLKAQLRVLATAFCQSLSQSWARPAESPAAFACHLVFGSSSGSVHRGGILRRRQNFTAAGLVRSSAAKRVWLPPRRKSTARGPWELHSVAADSRCRSGLIPAAPLFGRASLRIQGLLGRAGHAPRLRTRGAAQRSPREHSSARHPQRTAPGPPEAGDVILAER